MHFVITIQNIKVDELEIENRTVTLDKLSDFLNQGLFAGIVLGCAILELLFFTVFCLKIKLIKLKIQILFLSYLKPVLFIYW